MIGFFYWIQGGAVINNKLKYMIVSPKITKKTIFLLILILLFDFFFYPISVLAQENSLNLQIKHKKAKIVNYLPESPDRKVKAVRKYLITAYNSEKSQCDDSPCITANGFNVCKYGIEDTVATNFLPFGTKIRIPELFGDRVFVVRDRMNSRYSAYRLDIWMKDKKDALRFGAKIAYVEILE